MLLDAAYSGAIQFLYWIEVIWLLWVYSIVQNLYTVMS